MPEGLPCAEGAPPKGSLGLCPCIRVTTVLTLGGSDMKAGVRIEGGEVLEGL
jgi:hypothetical protein